MDPWVHSTTEEVENDVLEILFNTDSPMRHTEILSELMSRSIYQGKHQSLKSLLCRILRRYEDEGLVKRNRISHKNVQYKIRNAHARQKVKLRLSLKPSELDRIVKQSVHTHYISDFKIENLAKQFLFSYLLRLIVFEISMCKALAQRDEDSFRFFNKNGKRVMQLLWEAFTDLLWEKRGEARDYYKTSLREVDDEQIFHKPAFVAKVKDGWIINVDAYVRYTQALSNISLKRSELMVSVLQGVLEKCEKHLEWERQMASDPNRLLKVTHKFIEMVGRPLSYGELKELEEVLVEKRSLKSALKEALDEGRISQESYNSMLSKLED